MKRIYKYELEIGANRHLSLPYGFELLDIQVQDNKIYCWCIVDVEEKSISEIHYEVIETGHFIPDYKKLKHIKTVQLNDGDYVLHVFINI